jgi:hypothetical protein
MVNLFFITTLRFVLILVFCLNSLLILNKIKLFFFIPNLVNLSDTDLYLISKPKALIYT